MKFGVHISISGGISQSFSKAKKIGCNTFQIFTRNPRSWQCKNLTEESITKFKFNMEHYNINPVFSHMPYLPNLANTDIDLWEKSITSLEIELKRCDDLSIPFIVSHLGSSKGEKKEKGITNVINALNRVLNNNNGKCKILLENTAGKNQRLGSSIVDICNIVSEVEHQEKIGLCFDTCHAFASGYDLREKDVIESILIDIDDCIRLDKLLLIHCNDTLSDLNSGVDRHEHIGLGKIGDIGFKNLLNDKRLKNIPFICETPVDDKRNDEENLQYLKSLSFKIKKEY